MATNIDTEFRRFQQTRNPEALATVFDAVAPRLLLVAMHLCRDAAAAEDLVQTVFLQAIRDVEQFDSSRPVMPWLLGILEHRGHDRRERAHVTRERGSRVLATVGSVVADPNPGPQSVAEDAELRSQVATALDSVPTNYREVLTLRLVHGLRAVDIAHAQGVSPETVRTKLRRGLAMLRSSLPRGVATAPLLTLLATECLRASNRLPGVRRTVLRSITGPATAMAGTLAMKWLWGGGVAAAIVIGALLAIAPPEPTPPNTDTQARQPQPAASSSSSNTIISQPTSVRLQVPANATTSMRDATTVLQGHVTSQPHGHPLANATVSMRTYSDWSRGGMPVDWVDQEPVTADASGAFRFAFVPPPGLYFEFKAEAPGFVPQWANYESLRKGIVVDVGQLELERGTPVRLRVLVEGQPCPDLEVNASTAKHGRQPTSMYGQNPTDQDGYSDFGMCGAGTWHYRIDTQLAGPTVGTFEVPLQPHELTHTVKLQMPAAELSIRGTVVDQFANPVAGLTLHMPVEDGWGYNTAVTNNRGAFVFSVRQLPDGNPKKHLELPDKRTDLQWLANGGEFVSGTNDLELIVRRRATASLRLEVVDAVTGEPIEEFGARCIPDPWRRVGGSANFTQVAPTHQAHGVQVFDNLRPAPYRVSVFPTAPYAEQTWLSVDLIEGQTSTLRVLLAPPAELAVALVAADTGKPMSDVQVALCRLVPEHRFEEVGIDKYRKSVEQPHVFSSGYKATNAPILDRGQSNEHGLLTLRAAAETPAMALFLTAPHCREQLVVVPELPQAGAEMRIKMQSAATLTGAVTPLAFVTRFGPSPKDLAEAATQEQVQLPEVDRFVDDYPEVELRRVGSDDAATTTHVDADGKFSFVSLPPDNYEVWLTAQVAFGRRSSSSSDFGPLTTVTVTADGDPPHVTLDASHLVPARASGRFYVDGKLYAGEVGLARIGKTSASKVSMSSTNGELRSSPWLVPGRYVPFAKVQLGHDIDRPIFGLVAITIAPGQDVEFTAVLQRRAIVVTLRGADGKPLADRRVVPQSLDHPHLAYEWRYGVRTDEKGRAVFDPAPLGRLRVMAFAPTQKLGRAYVQPEVLLGELSATQQELSASWPK